ncbi:hypothetical protein 2016DhaA_0495 [Vibrio phage ICP1]|jgi:hypothetical protein|nr:hypothetical protein ICP12011A_101 [Vibrio phage ICP1_2011_A]QFR59160.1 hypothetical protein ICP12017FMathbaria_100 [Vibrio phage ICP1_2017_F_Mathbaria]QVV99316.1 hypothetical protein 2015DhaA_0490 [Vibrio phage ICP1]HAS3707700.1 hypothetical protein [Vibrio cholerae]QVV99536.1 hypothetical protein 2016DhaA_0495 [Vibrio phage ICP1]
MKIKIEHTGKWICPLKGKHSLLQGKAYPIVNESHTAHESRITILKDEDGSVGCYKFPSEWYRVVDFKNAHVGEYLYHKALSLANDLIFDMSSTESWGEFLEIFQSFLHIYTEWKCSDFKTGLLDTYRSLNFKNNMNSLFLSNFLLLS